MQAGYSGTPLVKKLGIKQGFSITIVNPPENYWQLLGALPEGVNVRSFTDSHLDFVHLFLASKADLDKNLRPAKMRIVPQGMLWVSWPKKSSGMASGLNENVIRDAALALGLVDVKVCAVDQTWSGLKLVIRLKDRK